MKNLFYYLALCLLLTNVGICLVACDSDEGGRSLYELAYRIGSDEISVDQDVLFTDLSLGVVSQEWTFEDAVPQSSNLPQQKVRFVSRGTKRCSLKVVYDNGRTEQTSFEVDVKQQLVGKILVEDTTKMGCLRLSVPTPFDIEELKGDPSSIKWTFEGGTPATSTDKSTTVTWNKAGRYKVTLEMKRADDNITFLQSKEYIVGPYPLLRTLPEYRYDPYSFEYGTVGEWTLWFDKSYTQERCSIVEDGADGSSKCMKIDFQGATGNWQLFFRDSWVTNAHLKKDANYQLSFWAKVEKNNPDLTSKINRLRIINKLGKSDWNSTLDVTPENDWAKFCPGVEFEEQVEADVLNLAPKEIPELTQTWAKYKFDFVVDQAYRYNKLLNAYMLLLLQPATSNLKSLYIDEVQINLIEN